MSSGRDSVEGPAILFHLNWAALHPKSWAHRFADHLDQALRFVGFFLIWSWLNLFVYLVFVPDSKSLLYDEVRVYLSCLDGFIVTTYEDGIDFSFVVLHGSRWINKEESCHCDSFIVRFIQLVIACGTSWGGSWQCISLLGALNPLHSRWSIFIQSPWSLFLILAKL